MAQKAAETLAVALEAHPDYRVLRRLDVSREWPALTGREVSQAVLLDTETTGLDPATDKMIELAMVKFEYSRATGEVGRVLGVYDGLEDPEGIRLEVNFVPGKGLFENPTRLLLTDLPGFQHYPE